MVGSNAYGQSKYDDANRDSDSWYDGLGRDRGSGRLQKDGLQKQDMTPEGRQRETADAKNNLRGAEEGASGSSGLNNRAGIGAAAEREKSGLYKPTSGGDRGVKKEKGVGKGNKKGKFKGLLKKGGPMMIILLLVCGTGGFMTGMQSMLPFSLEELIIEKFNSVGVSSTIVSDKWLDTQLNYAVKSGDGSDGENLFALSEHQAKEFEKQGVKVFSNVGSFTGMTVLLYQKNGEWIPVVGSSVLSYNEQELVGAIKRASGLSNIGRPVSAKTALADPVFKNAYTAASKTWRGGTSGWFDNIMSGTTEVKLGLSRNRWARFLRSAKKTIEKNFIKTAGKSKGIDGTSDGGITDVGASGDNEAYYADSEGNLYPESDLAEGEGGKWYYIHKEIDADGNEIDVKTEVDIDHNKPVDVNEALGIGDDSLGGIKGWAKNVSEGEAFQKINGVLNSKAMKAATALANGACAVVEGLVSIYTVVSAYQSIQFLNLSSGFLESVDKVKAGDGSGSPMYEYSNNLTKKANTIDSASGEERTVVAENKTAMESAGILSLFGATMPSNDASVNNVNFESLMANMGELTKGINFTDNIKLTAETYKICGYVKIGTAAVSLATTILSLIPVIGGVVKGFEFSAKAAIKAGVKLFASLAFAVLLPIATAKVAKLLIKNAATEWFGEDLGNALVSGTSKYLGGNGTSGGQSGASEGKLMAYKIEQNAVIAEEAKYQRSIRSPFDMTSKYTFLGSLAYAMMPLAYSSGSIMSVVGGVSNLATSSLVAMLPTASAIGAEEELTSIGDCPLLNSTGAVGDAFCNPYVVTDTSTVGIAPEEISYIVHTMNSGGDQIASLEGASKVKSDNFDADGKINSGSDLGKYAIFCGQRTSPLGLKDAAIGVRLTKSDSTAMQIINYIPGVNDIADIATGTIEAANLKWMTGQSCVASEENSDWENEYKYYQRYLENERLLENMNPGYESPVTELMGRYYEENPVDNSFEGQLARFSGMSKEDVSDTLALIEYLQFLDEYDASTRYAFGVPAVEAENKILFDNDNVVAENVYIVTLNNILYADVRNRSFAV